MAEEIKGIHIFAETMDGTLREVSMTQEEKDMWLGVIGKFYNCSFKLSPVGVKIPLISLNKENDTSSSHSNVAP